MPTLYVLRYAVVFTACLFALSFEPCHAEQCSAARAIIGISMAADLLEWQTGNSSLPLILR